MQVFLAQKDFWPFFIKQMDFRRKRVRFFGSETPSKQTDNSGIWIPLPL